MELLLPLVNAHCCFPSRSHLQPPSYGPVLSPMNKVHGGVNKLPSVNQLVGQPPPHSSAAGPNLGPMGKCLGLWRPHVGCRDPSEGLVGFTKITNRTDGGLLMAASPCSSSLEEGNGCVHPNPRSSVLEALQRWLRTHACPLSS